MRSTIVFFAISLLALTPLIAFADSATQTDWSGGPGLWGPVTEWENVFYLDDEVDWSKNPGSVVLSTFIEEHLVDDNFYYVYDVHAADIDGDGDYDVLGAADYSNCIKWWENVNGSGTSWESHTIDGQFVGAISVYSEDIDNDGDLDVLGAASDTDQVAWWENTDGAGTSWVKHSVDDNFHGANSVYSEDINGDGDYDIIGAASSGIPDDVTWWENADGSGTSWIEHIVDEEFYGGTSVYSQDIDDDGDMDLLGAAWHDNQIVWWENTDGIGINWTRHLIKGNFDNASSVYSEDMDGDGDWDVLGSSYSGHCINWWENSDTSPGLFIAEHTIDNNLQWACSAYPDDLDGDGDRDVLAGGKGTYWWENTDGFGTSWTKHIVKLNNDPCTVSSADINGNGEVDVLATLSPQAIAWWDIDAYSPTSSLESSVLNTCAEPSWNILDWDADTPSGTSVSFQVRASDNYTNMGDWSAVL